MRSFVLIIYSAAALRLPTLQQPPHPAQCGRRSILASALLVCSSPLAVSAAPPGPATTVEGLDAAAGADRIRAPIRVDVRPISGPQGLAQAMVSIRFADELDPDEHIDYVWLKAEGSTEVLSGRTAVRSNKVTKGPPPEFKFPVNLGTKRVVPMVYLKKLGVWEGEPFDVEVSERFSNLGAAMQPKSVFDERGYDWKGRYEPDDDSPGGAPQYTNPYAARLGELTDQAAARDWKPGTPTVPIRRDGYLSIKPNNMQCDANGRNCKFTGPSGSAPGGSPRNAGDVADGKFLREDLELLKGNF